MQDKVFYSICFGFLFGVLFRSFILINSHTVAWLGLISFFLLIIFYSIYKNKWGILAAIFLIFTLVGIFRFQNVDNFGPYSFGLKVGEKADFTGQIVDEPDVRENTQKLLIEVRDSNQKTKILLTTNLGEYYKYGDEISFSGKLEKPKNFVTDQGKVFDYVNYLKKDGVFYVMNYASIDIVSRGNGNFIKEKLFAIKESFLEKINSSISYPENLLMSGLVLGEKSSFSPSLRQEFVDTGTIHIVALSGYNITIVAEWFMKLFKFLPHLLGIGAGIFAIILFVLMTGGSSTGVRAGIMAILMLIARATRKNYDVSRALILTAVGMILFNPLILVYDVSFQLSFIATVAVIFLSPRIEKYFTWVPESFGIRDVVTVTCAAYFFVLPFILYKMGNLSIVALPANILVLPLIPATMLVGFITAVSGFISHLVATPVGFIAYVMLHYELGVINFFSKLPYSSFSFSNFPLVLTIVIYSYFVYLLFGRSIKKFFVEEF